MSDDHHSDEHLESEAPHGEEPRRDTLNGKPSALLVELGEHVPFSVSAVTIGLVVAGIICIVGFGEAGAEAMVHEGDHAGHSHASDPAKLFFHLFHPAHMFFSAVATTAMFIRYERRLLKAIIVGIVGAIGVCGVSDIVMPHASLAILGVPTPWHICVYKHPMLVLPFTGVGVVVGVVATRSVTRSTIISHSLHVFISTMASIFYMVGPLGLVEWIDQLGQVFIFIVLAVMLPCCISDIVFPLLMSKPGRATYVREPHRH